MHWRSIFPPSKRPYQEHKGTPWKTITPCQWHTWFPNRIAQPWIPILNLTRDWHVFLYCETCSQDYETKHLVHTPWLLGHYQRLLLRCADVVSSKHTQEIKALYIIRLTTVVSLCHSASIRNQFSHSSLTYESVCKPINYKLWIGYSLFSTRYLGYLSQHW